MLPVVIGSRELEKSLSVPSGVMTDMAMENGPLKSVIFLLKIIEIGSFPNLHSVQESSSLPCLMKPDGMS